MPPARPQTWAEIDLAALARNFRRFAECFPAAGGFIFSAKKDAYGHGLAECARALEPEARLWGAGAATAAETLRLKAGGFGKPALCFSVLRGDELAEAIRAGVILTVTAAGDAEEAGAAAAKLGTTARAHFKIDTGMGRLGLGPEESLEAAIRLRSAANLRIEAVYTHFPNAWDDPAGAAAQTRALDEFRAKAGLAEGMRHIGGSDALGLLRAGGGAGISVGANMVIRAGIAFYGAHPGIAGLEPVMTLKSRVIYRKRMKAGAKISYGGTATLARDSEIALVGAGYGNGYPISLSNKGEVLIRGRRCPVLGRVCMDQIIADVTGAAEARVGDEAVLFGGTGESSLSVSEAAKRAGTTPYELLCVAGQINPRVYAGG